MKKNRVGKCSRHLPGQPKGDNVLDPPKNSRDFKEYCCNICGGHGIADPGRRRAADCRGAHEVMPPAAVDDCARFRFVAPRGNRRTVAALLRLESEFTARRSQNSQAVVLSVDHSVGT